MMILRTLKWKKMMMKNNKKCINCKWYEEFTGACCNGDSVYCADFVDNDNSCERFDNNCERTEKKE